MNNLPISKKTRTTLIAIIAGIMVIILAMLTSLFLSFNLVENLVMSWILTTIYALFAFFLIEPKVQVNPLKIVEKPVYRDVIEFVETPVIKEVENKVIEFIEKPIIEAIQIPIENRVIEVIDRTIIKPIQIPIENRVIEVVEMPVIKEVQVEKIVYRTIEKPRKKLNIQKFEFIGSTQTKTYHKRNCKFSKMLKKKYKLHNNSIDFFKNKHYHACKTCLKRNSKKEEKQNKNLKKKIQLKKDNYKAYKETNPNNYRKKILKEGNYKACLALINKK